MKEEYNQVGGGVEVGEKVEVEGVTTESERMKGTYFCIHM